MTSESPNDPVNHTYDLWGRGVPQINTGKVGVKMKNEENDMGEVIVIIDEPPAERVVRPRFEPEPQLQVVPIQPQRVVPRRRSIPKVLPN